MRWLAPLLLLAAAVGCDGGVEIPGGTGAASASGGGATSSASGAATASATSSASGGGEGGGASSAVSAGGGGAGSTASAGGEGGGITAGAGGAAVGGAGGAGGTAASTGTGVDPNALDQDGDGWTPSDGDCCDVAGGDCIEPALVNPGAFEHLGNQRDDDCDPGTLDFAPPPPCGGGPLETPTAADALLQAMDLCRFTTEDPPLAQRTWGVISSALVSADPASPELPHDVQAGVLAGYGANVLPAKGPTLAALSSGTARDEGDPGHVYPQNGSMPGQTGSYATANVSGAPPAYLAANGGTIPTSCGSCMGAGCDTAFDSVNLRARIRVPTNAKSLAYRVKLYTAEYPEYVCQGYHDVFVALLTSAHPLTPADTNIAIDGLGDSLSVDSPLLDVCAGCPAGALELAGTGMGGWNGELQGGAGTVWLIDQAPAVPGETIELELVIWDGGDHQVDSIVLLDGFRWSVIEEPTGLKEPVDPID